MNTPRLDTNFFDPTVIVDPYPVYEQVRALGRVVWNDVLQAWLVPGYDDCRAVLADTARFSNALYRDPTKVWWFETVNMVMVDPPEHRRLRNPLSPLFSRGAVERWEATVHEIVDDVLAPLSTSGEAFDIIGEFSMIPTMVLGRMIGVPPSRQLDFRRWSATIAGSLAYGSEDPQTLERMRQASNELADFMSEEFERHRREMPDDLLTAMLTLPDESRLSDAEIRSTISVLLLAGYDTTAKLMSNSLVVLENYPEQRRQLVDDPSRIPAAIEEMLRWCGVLHGVLRTAERDTHFADAQIKAGELVCTLPAAANRDPSRWVDPAVFDINRDLKPHVAFGHGPHMCIGAALARLENRIALERLLRLFPDYAISDVDYGKAWFIRGPERGLLHPLTRSSA